MSLLSAQLPAFCGVLREQHGFAIGVLESQDALRALETVGVDDRERVQTALRLVCCASLAERAVFDRAFAAFFATSMPGVPQAAHAPRHSRPGTPAAADSDTPPPTTPVKRPNHGTEDDDADAVSAPAQRGPAPQNLDAATQWQALRARLSPHATRSGGLGLDAHQAAALRPVAARMVALVRLGRSRRWKALEHGSRFDIRRTLRASLQTGGDPIALRFLGHPRHNPRFVVLVDGSRSMDEYASFAVAFAAALCDRTARAHVFTFSTALRDITRELRAAMLAQTPLSNLGEAWGGGTRIGASLARFVATAGARLLTPATLVIIVSDGLDAGDIPQLERAIHEIDRRSAGIVWLNPLSATPGYVPSARGIRAVLPYVTLYAAANDAAGLAVLADRLARLPRTR